MNRYVCSALFLLLFCLSAVVGHARAPLLVDGKKSLFQRVIAHPQAMLFTAPGEETGVEVRSFTPFYVYGLARHNDVDWLEVAVSSEVADGETRWMRRGDASRWDKALTLMFADRMQRDPVLFFRDYSALNDVIRSSNLQQSMGSLMRALVESPDRLDLPVIAMEPAASAIPKENFYLMPVFDFSSEYAHYNMRILRVGAVNPGEVLPQSSEQPAQEPQVQEAQSIPSQSPSGASDFTAGITFIVDTTISMGPYVEKTKEFIRNTFDSFENSSIKDRVSFGIVNYRNSLQHNPEIGYVAKVVSPLTPVSGRASLESALGGMAEASVSTHAFNEDAFSGIKTAIDELDWGEYPLKVAVLVTDAGAIRNDDPYSGTGINEKEMAELLRQKGIRLVVVHLQTEAGKRNNLQKSIAQYKALTAMDDASVKHAYIALPVQSLESATQLFNRVAEALVGVVQKIIVGLDEGKAPVKPAVTEDVSSPEKMATLLGESIGYAAQLEFFGKRTSVQGPQFVEAWVADKDLNALSQGKSTDALVVAVLLSKSQLDALARQMQHIVDAARASRTDDSRQLFQRIISVSAQTLRDPERMQQGMANRNLVEMGLLPEFLEGLPYKSMIMNMTEQQWFSMSAREQDEIIYAMESKIKIFKEYHNDTANWTTFVAKADEDASGERILADSLYRVPLSSLP